MPYGNRNRTHLEALKRANKQRDEELNKRLNLTVSGAEKIGTVANIVKEFNDWEVVDLDQQDAAKEAERTRKDIYKVIDAHTINPPRPRAWKVAYTRGGQMLMVKFRDGTDCLYRDVPEAFWQNLKVTDSTGRYLKYSGIDNMGTKFAMLITI